MALSPPQPPEEGDGPQGPPARQPPAHLSRVPTDLNPCTTSVPLGYFWGAREPQTLKCPPQNPLQTDPKEGLGGFVRCD